MVGSLFSKRPLETISRLSVCCLALVGIFLVLPQFCLLRSSAVVSGVVGGGGAVKRRVARGVSGLAKMLVSNSGSGVAVMAGLVALGWGDGAAGDVGSTALRAAMTVRARRFV